MVDIEEASITQKARSTAKQLKHYKDAKSKVDECGGFLIRKAKIDTRSCPKWKRVEQESEDTLEDLQEVDAPFMPPACQDYTTMLISCPVCSQKVETARMQLSTPLGFRYVSCNGCEKQRWSRGWTCECGVAWHTCSIHRIDPVLHRSAKPPKRPVGKERTELNYKDSERAAPEAVQSVSCQPQKRAKGSRTLHVHGDDTGAGATSFVIRPSISERWKRKIDDNQRKRRSQEMQMVVFKSNDDKVEERRANLFSHSDDVLAGSKRQCVEEDTRVGGLSSRILRESLIAKANELRHKQRRNLDDPLDISASEKPKPKRIRLQGDDAITRLINLGRP